MKKWAHEFNREFSKEEVKWPVRIAIIKAIFFLTWQFSLDQEGASMCSLLLSKHASTKWLTVAPPYIPVTVVPASHLGFVQVKGSQSFPIV
jgi:hypothetical protein